MKNGNDVYTPADYLTDRLGILFSPTPIARIQLTQSGVFDQHSHNCSLPIYNHIYIEKLIQEFDTHPLGTFNLGHNSEPIETIPCQFQTLINSGFIEHTGASTVHESGGGNNPNREFIDKKFNELAQYMVTHEIDITHAEAALSVFNDVDRSLDPISFQQYYNLKTTKKFHDSAVKFSRDKKGIKAAYIYGNVRLGNSEGLVTPVFLGPDKGYEILNVPVDPRIRQLANIFAFVLQNKKKEGINMFLEEFPDPGFTVVFLDLFNILGDGWLGNKRLFKFEHPTKLGYYIISLYLAYRMLINGQNLDTYQSSKI